MKWDWGLTPLHLSLFVWSISRARCEQHMSLAEAFIPFNSQWLYCPTVPPQHRGQTVFILPADWNVMDKNSFPLDYLKNMQEADSITFIHLFVDFISQKTVAGGRNLPKLKLADWKQQGRDQSSYICFNMSWTAWALFDSSSSRDYASLL